MSNRELEAIGLHHKDVLEPVRPFTASWTILHRPHAAIECSDGHIYIYKETRKSARLFFRDSEPGFMIRVELTKAQDDDKYTIIITRNTTKDYFDDWYLQDMIVFRRAE